MSLTTRAVLLALVAILVPACGVGGGGGTLTPTVAPAAPTGLVAKSGNGRVLLTWNVSPAASTYTVQKSQFPGGPYVDVPAGVGITTTSFVDANLTNGSAAYYIVVAGNAFGQSPVAPEVQGTPGFKAAQIHAGERHTLALLQDGTLWCWGWNANGQLGNNSPAPLSNVAVQVPLTSVATMAGGSNHTLALLSDGTVKAWGQGTSGQLGNGGTSDSNVPVPASGLTGVVAVSAGRTHSIALRSNGTVWQWGESRGVVPTQVSGLNGVTAIVAGDFHDLALLNDGTVMAWGSNPSGQLGNGTNGPGFVAVPVQTSNLTGVVALAAGLQSSLALRNDGTVWGWGASDVGQLGTGPLVAPWIQFTPTLIPSLSGIVKITMGNASCLALQADGSVWGWGGNGSGELADGTQTIRYTPVPIPALSGLASLRIGGAHGIGMLDDGTVLTWGSNDTDQLGNGSGGVQPSPSEAANVNGAVAVAGGDLHSAMIRAGVTAAQNTVWTWGSNQSLQLGIASPPVASAFRVQVPSFNGAVAIACGAAHNVVARSDGTVWTWGRNNVGQLGQPGVVTGTSTPGQVAGITGATVVAAGSNHCLVINGATGVQSWGVNVSGQLGYAGGGGNTVGTIAGFTNITALGAGLGHSLAVQGTGPSSTVWAWGFNGTGELGIAPGPVLNTPNQVPGLTGFVAVAAGAGHSVALDLNGNVWAWGRNNDGQLGRGTTGTTGLPAAVSGLANIVAIASGFDHTIALRNDGTVWAWGQNGNGQLGNSLTSNSSVPVSVIGLTNVVSIGAGTHHSQARLADGTVWSWGRNMDGEIGIGTSGITLTPILVTR